MKHLFTLLFLSVLLISQPALARHGADDPAGDDHGGRTPTARPHNEVTPRPNDDHHNGGDSGNHDSKRHDSGWIKLRPVSGSTIKGVRAKIRESSSRSENRVRAQIAVVIPNTSLGFASFDQALAATYQLRIANAGASDVICTLAADQLNDDSGKAHSTNKAEFALDLKGTSSSVTNKKGSCVTDGDVTQSNVLPNLVTGTTVTASLTIAGQSSDFAKIALQ